MVVKVMPTCERKLSREVLNGLSPENAGRLLKLHDFQRLPDRGYKRKLWNKDEGTRGEDHSKDTLRYQEARLASHHLVMNTSNFGQGNNRHYPWFFQSIWTHYLRSVKRPHVEKGILDIEA